MSSPTQVAAAVSVNHETPESLTMTIDSLRGNGYASIVILENTGDTAVIDCAKGYGDPVELLAATDYRLSRGENRNRIFDASIVRDTGIDPDNPLILHFVDSGTALITNDAPHIIRTELERTNADDKRYIGIIGGLVLDGNATQFALNYGPNICGVAKALKAYSSAAALLAIEAYKDHDNDRAKALRNKLGFLLRGWPNTFAPAEPKEVGYVYEANMAIKVGDLVLAQGFPDLPIHEIQPVAHELARRGLACRFEPRLKAIQPDPSLRGKRPSILAELSIAAQLAVYYSLPSNRKPVTME